jgi:ABC-type transporter Mla subunit MlaD
MATESVSFRITRNTEDLAQATHALSQRLVKLEQRLQALEVQLAQLSDQNGEQQPAQLDSLENVERLLHDCRCLLGLEDSPAPVSLDMAESDQQLAA